MDNQTVEQFIIFCLESYKTAIGISDEQAFNDFEKYDVFTYLAQGYDVLHTQGKLFIVADIKEYIANRKNNETISR